MNLEMTKTKEFISLKDIENIFLIIIFLLVAFIVKPQYQLSFSKIIAKIIVKIKYRKYRIKKRLERIFGNQVEIPVDDAVIKTMALAIAGRLNTFNIYLSRNWHPQVDVYGIERIEAALRDGKGVILWVSTSSCSSLITKLALHRLGYKLLHLSTPEHGTGSGTVIGVKYINPFYWKIESRYLKERVILQRMRSKPQRLYLQNSLERNEIVSIAVGNAGLRTARVPFFNGQLEVATGVPHLALISGAALLPVMTIQTGNNRFQLLIGERLDFSECKFSDDKYYITVIGLAKFMEKFFVQDIAQFHSLLFGSSKSMIIDSEL